MAARAFARFHLSRLPFGRVRSCQQRKHFRLTFVVRSTVKQKLVEEIQCVASSPQQTFAACFAKRRAPPFKAIAARIA